MLGGSPPPLPPWMEKMSLFLLPARWIRPLRVWRVWGRRRSSRWVRRPSWRWSCRRCRIRRRTRSWRWGPPRRRRPRGGGGGGGKWAGEKGRFFCLGVEKIYIFLKKVWKLCVQSCLWYNWLLQIFELLSELEEVLAWKHNKILLGCVRTSFLMKAK